MTRLRFLPLGLLLLSGAPRPTRPPPHRAPRPPPPCKRSVRPRVGSGAWACARRPEAEAATSERSRAPRRITTHAAPKEIDAHDHDRSRVGDGRGAVPCVRRAHAVARSTSSTRCWRGSAGANPRCTRTSPCTRRDARLAAEAADKAIRAGHRVGPLHGVPIALKDLVDLEGRVTTGGSKVWEKRVSTVTATLAERLIGAGMIVLGKTHTVEFAMGSWGTNTHMGTPRNPWDLKVHRTPGGSSSGSGVAVAAGSRAGRHRHRHGRLGARPRRVERHRRAQGHRRAHQHVRRPAAQLHARHAGPARRAPWKTRR